MLSDVSSSNGWKWGLFGVFWIVFLVSTPAQAQGPATLTGTVVDSRDGEPLIGATVLLRDVENARVVEGTITDPDGNFQFARVQPGKYALRVRFIGYKERSIPLTIEADESRVLDVALDLETESLETVVVSASRQREKVLDAPASISVLEPVELRREVTTSSVEALRSAPGVDMAQTGVDRREVALRGFNEAFSRGIHVLTDNREAAVPALGVNAYNVMPSIPLDLSRVEVVRGPGSALYGPGVDSGVIHFFTKDPFQEPGTSVSVSGGSRQFVSAQIRQAGVLGETVGYKVTAQLGRADEWELDPDHPQDAAEIARYRVYQDPSDPALTGRNFATGDFDGDGETEAQLRRENQYHKYNVNGMLAYRLGNETRVTLNGGYSELKSVFQSGVGTLQTDGFGYSYSQLRLDAGDFFAQVYLNQNHSGEDTYVYGTGAVQSDNGLQWNGQLQYTFALDPIDTRVVAGADVDLLRPRTDGTVLGRNEGSDDVNEYGGYVQTTTDLADPLSLTLAGRADYNNVVEEVQLSPRAALVFSAGSDHTLRASYNRAFSSPGVNSLFLDVSAQREPLGNGRELVFQGLGAADGFTFSQFEREGTARSLLPAGFKQPLPVNQVPLRPLFGSVVGGLNETAPDQLPAPLNTLSASEKQLLVTKLGPLVTLLDPQQSTTSGELGLPDDSESGYRVVGGPRPIEPLQQTTTQTLEGGYKGTIADRVRVSVDGYYEQKQDFVGPLRVESPLLFVPDLESDLGTALTPLLQQAEQNDPELEDLLQRLGISARQASQLIAGIGEEQIGGSPVGVVQPDQEVLPGGGTTEQVGGFLSYRNFGEVEYWGVDASVELDLTDTFTAFGNVSYVSDDFFDNEDLDETDTSLSLALNAPSFKTKGGFDFGLPAGFSVGVTVHYVDGFPVRSGPYVGDVEAYTLLDVRADYNVPAVPGLRLTLTGKNVLDDRHREFVGAPPLGRMLMGRLTYDLP